MGNSVAKPKEGETLYEVVVHTGSRKFSGTDADIFMTLHGTDANSSEIQLTHKLRDDFEKGQHDKFSVVCPELGDLWLVDMWISIEKKLDHWFLSEIIVTNTRTTQVFKFPAHRWIHGKEEIWEGTGTKVTLKITNIAATLPQKDKLPIKLQQRLDELEKKRGIYQWKRVSSFPSIMKSTFATLPYDECWNQEKLEDVGQARTRVAINIGLDKFFEKFSKGYKHFDDFKVFFNTIKQPPQSKDWMSDDVFGRQRLQGLNPTALKRVTKFPILNFPVTTEAVKSLLRPGTTLESEFKENRLFIVDNSNFAPYTSLEYWKPGRFSASPRCLLYLNSHNRLTPIAIQVTDVPDARLNPIFTPLSPPMDWLFAKMWVCNAEAWHHQLAVHLLAVHFCTEPIALATHRQLPSCHPVYKLLLPHFKFQIAINCRAREILIAPGGPVDEISPYTAQAMTVILGDNFKRWRFDKMSVPVMLQANGTDDPSILPNYFYRDDAVRIWAAMKKFIHELLSAYYTCDADVEYDFELQNWATDIVSVGFNGEEKGFPSKFKTFEQLVESLTIYVFTVSAQHAALNFGQYESLAFIPAAPGHLAMPPPGYNGKPWVMGELTMADILRAMPNRDCCSKQIAIAYILSQFSSEDSMLGYYPENLFIEPSYYKALIKYQVELEKIGKDVDKRGNFIHLHPRRVPNSTAI